LILPALVPPRRRDAFDQAAVGQEVLDRGEAFDVAHFVEDGQAEILADARDGEQQGKFARGLLLGQADELGFQRANLFVVMADHSHVGLES
jgi:hypothetical protein